MRCEDVLIPFRHAAAPALGRHLRLTPRSIIAKTSKPHKFLCLGSLIMYANFTLLKIHLRHFHLSSASPPSLLRLRRPPTLPCWLIFYDSFSHLSCNLAVVFQKKGRKEAQSIHDAELSPLTSAASIKIFNESRESDRDVELTC